MKLPLIPQGLSISIALCFITSATLAPATTISNLHSFPNNTNPFGPLTIDGSVLIGATSGGGSANHGTVYRMNSDGSSFATIHSFSGDEGQGGLPMTLVGTTLYGETSLGGSSGGGTVFRMSDDGTGFQTLHSFASSANDSSGSRPAGAVLVNGTTIYGTTTSGGASSVGILYRMQTDGSGFQNIHTFSNLSGLGSMPTAQLILDGSTIFGTTRLGGTSGGGTIFRVMTDGTGYQNVFSFSSFASSVTGMDPTGLMLVGNTFYGTTHSGSTLGGGTVFAVEKDGSNFRLLHSFGSSTPTGYGPEGPLTLVGSMLYGITDFGASSQTSNHGTLYQINTDGSGFNILVPDILLGSGSNNSKSLVNDGTSLYGITVQGPGAGGGIIYSLSVPEPYSLILFGLGVCALAPLLKKRKRLSI